MELDAHINDKAFCDAALAVFDDWVAQGLVGPGRMTLGKLPAGQA